MWLNSHDPLWWVAVSALTSIVDCCHLPQPSVTLFPNLRILSQTIYPVLFRSVCFFNLAFISLFLLIIRSDQVFYQFLLLYNNWNFPASFLFISVTWDFSKMTGEAASPFATNFSSLLTFPKISLLLRYSFRY